MDLTSICSFFGEHPGILAVVFLLVCFIYGLSSFISGPKPGRNPFSVEHVRPPPETLVTDQKARNNVLKQRFKPQKIPENLDAIVIGSGIGGLSTAVLLGRAGQKVLVLEQHDQAGGTCHTFVDKGFEFDTGIHYVGEMSENESTRILIDQITEGQVTWVPMDREYDHIAVGPTNKPKRYSMKSGNREEFIVHLEQQFPSEKEAISKLIKIMDESDSLSMGAIIPKVLSIKLVKILLKTGIFHLMFRKFLKIRGTSVIEFLDGISDNKEFKHVLSYAFGDIGVPPSELGIVQYAQLMNHYSKGAYYPLGGTSEIAFQIIPVIERYGGRVLVDAPITKILLDNSGTANGVTVHRNSGDTNIYAKRIISSAGVKNTFKYLLPREIAKRFPLYQLIDEVGPSTSYLTVFVGINDSSSELGLPAGNTWYNISENTDQLMRHYMSLTVEEAANTECPVMFISFPSAKDPSWETKYPGKSAALLITLVPWAWFSKWKDGRIKHRGEEYDALKEKIGRKMWEQTEGLFPQLAGKLDYIDVGTPLSNKYYLGQPEGEIYGLDHRETRTRPEITMYLRPESGIPGLYLTGQDIMTGGFTPSLNSGVLTAGAILNRNLFDDLSALTKKIRRDCMDKKNR